MGRVRTISVFIHSHSFLLWIFCPRSLGHCAEFWKKPVPSRLLGISCYWFLHVENGQDGVLIPQNWMTSWLWGWRGISFWNKWTSQMGRKWNPSPLSRAPGRFQHSETATSELLAGMTRARLGPSAFPTHSVWGVPDLGRSIVTPKTEIFIKMLKTKDIQSEDLNLSK